MMWLRMSCPHPLPPVNATLKSPVLPAVDLLPESMAVVSEGVKGQKHQLPPRLKISSLDRLPPGLGWWHCRVPWRRELAQIASCFPCSHHVVIGDHTCTLGNSGWLKHLCLRLQQFSARTFSGILILRMVAPSSIH